MYKFRDAYVVIVSVDEQHLLEVFELRDGVVAVPHCLATLLTHNACVVTIYRAKYYRNDNSMVLTVLTLLHKFSFGNSKVHFLCGKGFCVNAGAVHTADFCTQGTAFKNF